MAGYKFDQTGIEIQHRLNAAGIYGFYPSKKWYVSKYRNQSALGRKIVFLGDSIFGAFSYYLQTTIKNNIGINGMGYFNLGRASLSSEMITFVSTGCVNVDQGATDDLWGLMGSVCKMHTGDSFSYTHPATGEGFTSLKLYYLKRDGGGIFRYRIDGGAWVDIDTQNVVSTLGITTVDTAIANYPTIKLIEVEYLSGGECWMYGIKAYNREQLFGVQCDFLNNGGSSCLEYAAHTNRLKEYLLDTDPDQVHILLGFNDIGSNRTVTQFMADLETLINEIKTSVPTYCDIVLYGYPETNNSALNASADEYFTAIKEYALENGYSIADIGLTLPLRSESDTSVFWADDVHMSATAGIYLIQNMLIQIINSSNAVPYLGKGEKSYKFGDLRLLMNKVISFFTIGSGGAITDNGPSIYTLNNSRLYFKVGALDYILRTDMVEIPVPIKLKTYTVATLPAASGLTQCIVWVSNETGGATVAYSNGTNWLRVYDNAIVS